MIKPVLCLVLLVGAGAAQAQAVWRCGAEGRSFSDQPCAEGHVVALAPAAAPAADDIGVAMRREQRLAQQYAEQRREQERQARAPRDHRTSAQCAPGKSLRSSAMRSAERPPQQRAKKLRTLAAAGTSPATVRVTRSTLD